MHDQLVDEDISVSVPDGWTGGKDGNRALTYLSTSDSLIHGGELRPGQAMLQVVVEEFDNSSTLDEFIGRHIDISVITKGKEKLGEQVVERRSLATVAAPTDGGCKELLLVSTKDPVGEGVSEVYLWDRYFCLLEKRIAIVRLIGWENDNKLESYRQIALSVASSIRVNSK